jgi:uncharacterized phiE125 gp8 family phage protein
MMLVEVTPVPQAALPIAAFKAHLRLGSGFTDDTLQDSLLEGFLRAALAAIEGQTGKALLSRAFDWTVQQWRGADRQVLPIAPVSAITAFDLIDTLGTVTAVAGAGWRLLPDMIAPTLVALNASLPTIATNGMARLRLTAGFGPAWADVPPDLAQATLMLAAHYYEYRHDTALGAGCMPFGVTALIDRYRPLRIGFGGPA